MIINVFRRFVTAVDTYPFSMAIATVGTTTMTGVVLLKATENNQYVQNQRPLSTSEAHFRAMVEDAQESTWKENFRIVALAQEQNMGIGGGNKDQREVANFLKRIDARSQEILREDQEFWRQKKEYENQQAVFATTAMW